MALKNIDDLKEGGTLTPNSELFRINYVKARRQIYRGDFRSLGVQPILDQISSVSNTLTVNWFRRVATFYPEFMFADRPEITFANERFGQSFKVYLEDLLDTVQDVNVDMLAFGTGVVASDPFDPLRFRDFQVDCHYEVRDFKGDLISDLLCNVRQVGDQMYLDLFIYNIDGTATWRIHKYEAGAIGEQIYSENLPPRRGRQVVSFFFNPDRTSIFDDMIPAVGEMSRVLTKLSSSIDRNLSPHLHGPENSLKTDLDNKAVLDVDGMFFPLREGEEPPGYLQWDTKLDAVKWAYEQSETNALGLAGLSPALFNPSLLTGVLSGTALKRILLPFVARLNHFANKNEDFLFELALLHNRNSSTEGNELFELRREDMEVEWTFMDYLEGQGFEDRMNEGQGREGNNDKRLNPSNSSTE